MLSACLPRPHIPPSLPLQLILPSCLLTSLPLPGGADHPPHEAPWDGADAGGSGHPDLPHCLARLVGAAGPCKIPKPQLCSGWTRIPSPGFPACCLPSFPFCLHPGALFTCFPWTWPVESPTGVHSHHTARPGRHCPLGRAPGWTCLMLLFGVRAGRALCPDRLCPHPSHPTLPLPQPHPWPWTWLLSQLGSQPLQALQGGLPLPLVSERIILSVDCPFL